MVLGKTDYSIVFFLQKLGRGGDKFVFPSITCGLPVLTTNNIMGNGQKREYPVLFWPKTDVPENNSGRECCWPYLIGQHPLSPVFGQKRPGTAGNSYYAQLPPVFGHFMFLSGGLLDYSNRSTWATRTINSKISLR